MASGIKEAWEEYADPLRRFVLRRVGNGHDAEDILQEVFLKAHMALAGVRDPGRLKPWLYRIAENTIADHHRARARTALSSEAESVEVAEEATEPGEPENANGEVLSCLGPMVEELPEKYRRAFVLADLEGKTQREVAGELGLSVPGAKSRVQRARRKLRVFLRACCRLEFDRVGNVLNCERKEKARCYRC